MLNAFELLLGWPCMRGETWNVGACSFTAAASVPGRLLSSWHASGCRDLNGMPFVAEAPLPPELQDVLDVLEKTPRAGCRGARR